MDKGNTGKEEEGVSDNTQGAREIRQDDSTVMSQDDTGTNVQMAT
jgi:hypothetical protein